MIDKTKQLLALIVFAAFWLIGVWIYFGFVWM